jgi:hypothetical protein
MMDAYWNGIPVGPIGCYKRGPIIPRLVRALRTNAQRAHDGQPWKLFTSRNTRIWQIAEAHGVSSEVAQRVSR